MRKLSPRGRRWLAVLGGTVAVSAVAVLAWRPAPLSPTPPAEVAFPWSSTPREVEAPAPLPQPGVAAPSPAVASATETAAPVLRGDGVFRTNEQGALVLDAGTRHRLEALLALNAGDVLERKVDAELATLPAGAAARARELVAQFEAFDQAQRAAYPPGQAPLVPQEGLAQLAGLQALRASHFGAEAARQMFGQDDAVARRLLELMSADASTVLGMEEKAVRAQARFDVERSAVRP